MRETRRSVGNGIDQWALVDAGEEWDKERIGVTVEEGEGKGTMVTRVMTHRMTTGRLTRYPRA